MMCQCCLFALRSSLMFSCCFYLTVPHPERTPSLVAHHQRNTSTPPSTPTKPCQKLLAKVPHLADSASTSMPRTAWVTFAWPQIRGARHPTLSGNCMSGSSATSTVTAALPHRFTPRPQSIHLAPAHHLLCLPPLQHLGQRALLAVSQYHHHQQTYLHQALLLVSAEPCPPHGGHTRRLSGWQSSLWVIYPCWTSPSLFPLAGPNHSCLR